MNYLALCPMVFGMSDTRAIVNVNTGTKKNTTASVA